MSAAARPRSLTTLDPEAWGLDADAGGALRVHGCRLTDLAREHGTPLHVVDAPRLARTARDFAAACAAAYRGPVSVHYAMKCNAVPAVVETIRAAGLRIEVGTEFELALAARLGFAGCETIANGPLKGPRFLRACVAAGVKAVVVDSLAEIEDLAAASAVEGKRVDVLLRVNVDRVPRGTSEESAAASRRSSVFGLDAKGGEVEKALQALRGQPGLCFRGFHVHAGTGIRAPKEHAGALARLPGLVRTARAAGFEVSMVDVGGGYASPTSREFTSFEMCASRARGRAPRLVLRADAPRPADYARAIARAVERAFVGSTLPEVVFEPGRSIAGPNQALLLTVHRVKERPGVGTWLVADGGLSTVTLPTYYEFHEVFLCDDVRRPRDREATIVGPACFGGDVVYRRKRMPEVRPGEVLAVMDAGAYFTGLESSFGFPRVAVAVVDDRGQARLARRRETFEDWLARDVVGAAPLPDRPRLSTGVGGVA